MWAWEVVRSSPCPFDHVLVRGASGPGAGPPPWGFTWHHRAARDAVPPKGNQIMLSTTSSIAHARCLENRARQDCSSPQRERLLLTLPRAVSRHRPSNATAGLGRGTMLATTEDSYTLLPHSLPSLSWCRRRLSALSSSSMAASRSRPKPFVCNTYSMTTQ